LPLSLIVTEVSFQSFLAGSVASAFKKGWMQKNDFLSSE